MEQIGAYGDVSRDLGERVISVAYYSLVNMNDFSPEILESHNATWTKISELPDLIFDHNQMINDTLSVLKKKAASRPIGFNLLPEQFTLPQLQTLYEAIYQTPFRQTELSQKAKRHGYSGETGYQRQEKFQTRSFPLQIQREKIQQMG